MTIEISIITVGYCSQNTLPACLRSISQQTGCNFEFIYVENAPQSPAISIVKKCYPSAIIIEPGENLGFSKGCNVGAQLAKGEYLLFLNPDCDIRTVTTLNNMLQFMHNYPTVGVCCPFFINAEGQAKSGAHRNYFADNYVANEFKQLPGTIAWVSGAALMISRKLFNYIGGFDERYFMYFEDVDICLSARKAGFSIAEVPKTQIVHVQGESVRKAWERSEAIYRLELARSIFTAKNYLPDQQKTIWKKYQLKKRLDIIKNYVFRHTKRLPDNLVKCRTIKMVLSSLKKIRRDTISSS